MPAPFAFDRWFRAIDVPAMRRPQVIMTAGLSWFRRVAIDPSNEDSKAFGKKGTRRGRCRSQQDGVMMMSARLVWFVMLAPTNASPSAIACSRMPAVPSLTTQIWEFAPLILVFLPEGVKGVHAGKALSPSWSA